MGKSLEDLFKGEFRREISNIGYKDIYKIPLPVECNKWEVSGTELYAVNGIDVPHYEKLNKTIVKRLPSGYTAKKRVIDKVNRTYLKNEDGTYVYEDYTVPNGSVVILSDIKIGVSYKEYKSTSKNGYGYIDFHQNSDGSVEYMYVLPKKVLFRVNQTALALSVKNMKNYWGTGYVTWDSGMMFLHIVPYKPNSKYEGTRILKTGYTLNYNSEVKLLLEYWQANGIIPNLSLCSLVDGDNLAMRGTTVGYEDYIPVESLALSDKEVYGSDGAIE